MRNDRFARPFFASTPTFFSLDDHEIKNDFYRALDPAVYDAALDNWHTYLGSLNPLSSGKSHVKGCRHCDRGSRHFSFVAGPADFFVLDTRYSRDEDKQILLGESQMQAVKDWLRDSSSKVSFKIIVSSVVVTRNCKKKDEGWNVAPQEREELLGFIEKNANTRVVFISGDSHMQGIFQLAPGVFEISASPLDAFDTHGVWGDSPDALVYEGAGNHSSGFAIYRLESDKITVEFFAAGVPLNTQVAAVVVIFLLLNLVLQTNRAASDASFMLLVVAVGIIVAYTIRLDDLSGDKSFHAPVFTFELDA